MAKKRSDGNFASVLIYRLDYIDIDFESDINWVMFKAPFRSKKFHMSYHLFNLVDLILKFLGIHGFEKVSQNCVWNKGSFNSKT